MDHRKLTQAELVAEAKERFGEDPMKWAFQCPTCKDIATAQEFRDALKEHPRERPDGSKVITSDLLGQECIGRTLGALAKEREKYTGRGCDWVAYVFGGPWEIVMPDGRIAHSFPLAPATEAAE